MPLPSGWSRRTSKENKPRKVKKQELGGEDARVLYYEHDKGITVTARYYPIFRMVDESPYDIYVNYPDGETIEHAPNTRFETFKETRKEAVSVLKSINRNNM